MDSMEEEKISVSVRVRPLSEREINRNTGRGNEEELIWLSGF